MRFPDLEEKGIHKDRPGQEGSGGKRWSLWKRRLRLFYLRLLRLKGGPGEVAGGMAIGVFIGMTPTVPFHTILAVLFALIFGKSKLAAAIGVWVANPIALPFVYILDFKVGQWITGTDPPAFVPAHFSVKHVIDVGWGVSYPLLIGGLVTGFLLAIPSYFITKRLIILYRNKRRKRPLALESPAAKN
jgi:uncharacterized protein